MSAPNPRAGMEQVSAEPVIARACRLFGIDRDVLLSASRKAEIVEARHAAMLALRRRRYTFPQIAAALNRRDHTTVIHGVRKAEAMLRDNPGFRHMVDDLANEVIGLGYGYTLGSDAWTPEQVASLKAMREAGLYHQVCANQLGVGIRRVQEKCRELGLSRIERKAA